MSLFSQLFAFVFCLALIACVLFVLFGQVTVGKLRKNPEAKNALGAELASGWDIINVAGALSRPKWLSRKLEVSRLAALSANSEVIYAHTNRFDRILGRLFFCTYVASGVLLVVFSLLSIFGIFEQ